MIDFHSIRFRLDDPALFRIPVRDDPEELSSVDRKFALRHVRITSRLFPATYETICSVFQSLAIEENFSAYVSADESLNALCAAGHEGPVIWLSSGLVKILSERELAFVVGHEIGHWFFRHHSYAREESNNEELRLRQALSRAAEISADRFGLVAVRDIDIALRAILKTASGLPDEYIGCSAGEYLQQARELKVLSENIEEVYASHPPMLVRARALMWFSMSAPYEELAYGRTGGESIATTDDRVQADLDAALGREYIAARREEIRFQLFWAVLRELASDGSLSKDDQGVIRRCFGSEYLQKVSALLRDRPQATAQSIIRSRADMARSILHLYSEADVKAVLSENTHLSKEVESRGISWQ